MQTPFYEIEAGRQGSYSLTPIMPRSRDTAVTFDQANSIRLHVGGALNRQMRRAQGVRQDASGALVPIRQLGRRLTQSPAQRLRRAELMAKGSRLDAAAENGTVADEFARIRQDAQTELFARFSVEWGQRLIARHDAQGAAGIAKEMARAHGADVEEVRAFARRADANMGPAGGLVENLTAYAFRQFREPKPPLHIADVFTVEGGINLGHLGIQMLLWSMTGQAQVFDGESGGSYNLGGPGVQQEILSISHFLSASPMNFIEEAREGVMMLNPRGIREENGAWAHESLHNDIAWGRGTSLPADLLERGLKNYPGLRVRSDGYTTSTITGQQWYNTVVAALRSPAERSSQAFAPQIVAMTVGFLTLGSQLPFTSGDATTALDMFRRNFPQVRIVECWELKDLVASSTEGVFGYPGDGDANPCYLRSPTMTLPEFSDGINIILRQHSASAGVYIASPVGAELRYITRS